MTTTTLTPPISAVRPVGSVRTVALLTGTELRLLVREPGVLVGLLAFPAVTVLILAGVFGSTPDPEFGGVVPSEHYIVGYVGVVLASMGLVALPATLAQHRERGVLRRYPATGVSAGTLVASHIALGAILGTVASVLVIAVGAAVYGVPAPADPRRRRSRGSSPGWPASSPSAAPSACSCPAAVPPPLSATSSSCRCSFSEAVAHRETS